MIFKLTKTSDYDFGQEVEINSLEELKELEDKYDNKLIVCFKSKEIEIYDDWRE